MTLREIVAACGGRYVGEETLLDATIPDIGIDSRTIKSGALYVPVFGERFDGHDFIDAARESGVACVLTDHPLTSPPYVLVPCTLDALQSIAAHYRNKFSIPVIGITGSVGKTTTKEMVAAVLSRQFSVLKTEGSLNSQTGTPQILFRLSPEHDVAVLEMGANHFGEIERLARMVTPTVCLLTNIGVAHIEFFGSRQGIFRAKTEMLPYLREGGRIIVNGDDDMLAALPNAMRYGVSDDCDLRAVDIDDLGLDGMAFTAVYGEKSIPVRVPAPGRHMVSNALAAMAVGLSLGLSLPALASGVAAYRPLAGRMSITRTGRFTLLDDSYNASPLSVTAAIGVLENTEGRRVCILGDMLELGERTDEYHEAAGLYAAQHCIELIIGVGTSAKRLFLSAQAVAPERSLYFETQDALLSALPALLQPGDTVLVKASRGMHMEQTVKALLAME